MSKGIQEIMREVRKKYKCPYCNLKTNKLLVLRDHIPKVHNERFISGEFK